MQYSTLIAQIEADIYSNGAELITGDILQTVLKRMVSAWASAGAAYGGTISPDTVVPLNLDQATVYLALTAGTYEHFLDGEGDPIETTGPALVIYDGGPALIFSKTDLPSGGSGATVITGGPGDSLVVTLPKGDEGIKASYRIDMTAKYTGGSEVRYIGSLIIEANELAMQVAHGYYYGDDMAEILSEVAIWKDDPEIYPDEQGFYLLLTINSDLDEVIFSVSSLDGQSVDADAANEDEKVKVADATITPVGGSSDVFWATYGSTTYADIASAHTAGKVCLADKGDNDYVYVLTYITATTARFTCARENGHYEVRCSSGNVWQTATYNLQSTDNRVSTISGNETNTTKYPNTKAVADAIAPLHGYQYIKDITPVAGTSTYKLADVDDYEEVRVEITRAAALSTGTATTLWIAYTLNGTDGRLNTANANLLMKFCRAVIWKKGVLVGGEMSRGNTIVGQILVPNADAVLPDGAVATEYQLQFASDTAWDAGDTIKVYGLPRTK